MPELKVAEPAGVVGFYLWGHIPEPWTLYKGIKCLPKGSYLKVKNGEIVERKPVVITHIDNATVSIPHKMNASTAMFKFDKAFDEKSSVASIVRIYDCPTNRDEDNAITSVSF